MAAGLTGQVRERAGQAGGGHGAGAMPSATTFYAQFDLDPVRGIKQLGEILEHVAARLGRERQGPLEVRAETSGLRRRNPRIVTENASNLGARQPSSSRTRH